jgi:hypothetical protein
VLAAAAQVLGVLAIVTGTILGYVSRSVFNSDAFANRVSASLLQPGVSDYVAERIADAVVAAKPDLVGIRPVIIAGGRSLVVSPPFRMAAQRAARRLHLTLMSGTGEKIMLSVRDVGAILKAALALRPELAAKLPPRLTASVADLHDLPAGEFTARVLRGANRARYGAILLLVAGALLLAFGVTQSRERRRSLLRIGITLALAGFVVWLVARFGGLLVARMPRDPEMGPLLAGLWWAFAGGLGLWGLALGVAGLVLAAAATSLLERTAVENWLQVAWRWMSMRHARPLTAFGRGLALAALGGLAMGWPLITVTIVAVAGGAVLTFIGVRECFAIALRSLPAIDPRSGERRSGWSPARAAMAGGLAVVIIVGIAGWVMRSPTGAAAPAAITACNGSPELCNRRLDQVVFAASHNSMSAADISDWMFPNQNRGIAEQLEGGVRAFLIDAHYGIPVGERVKTVFTEEPAATIAKYEAVVGKEGVDAAMRIRDRLVGADESRQQVYMAHGFCELGATPLVATFEEIRDFLAANPGEILILIVQDEGVSPQDIARCFEQSGLIDFVYRGPAKAPWPTLRQMAETDQRVLVLAENQTAGVPWYHPAFDVLQETPYAFHDTTEFSERANRGGKGGSLLLMNHWIETTPLPKPSNAAIVNAYDFLLRRARRCEKVRRHVPNLVAVDFYATGDLMKVVRTLNGLAP